ncbi:MAG: hypothetical protein MUC48_13380 [Leptolyngbya sp. Prado105]|nr:hypothetical protein [Leptolyngbya sp. Prado105]
MQPRRTPRRAHPLLAATFLLTTGFPLAPVFAEGTQAGTSISNTARQVQVGDTLYYTYSLTNVGNDPTSFRIPNLATVTGPGTPAPLEYSTDGGANWTAIAGSEVITSAIPGLTNGIAPGGSMLVRVPVTIRTNSAVQMGAISTLLIIPTGQQVEKSQAHQ